MSATVCVCTGTSPASLQRSQEPSRCVAVSTHSAWQHTARSTLLLLELQPHLFKEICSCCSLFVPVQAFAVDGTPADSVMLALNSPVFKVSTQQQRWHPARPPRTVAGFSLRAAGSSRTCQHAAAQPQALHTHTCTDIVCGCRSVFGLLAAGPPL